jgi:hypothetical protein
MLNSEIGLVRNHATFPNQGHNDIQTNTREWVHARVDGHLG